MQCVKCNGVHITGPTFERDFWRAECLRYRCSTCGYSWTTPTADAKAPPKIDIEKLKRSTS